MPTGPDAVRRMNLDVESGPAGCMGGMLNMFDWNSALLGGKKFLTDVDSAEGLEAPRNSLDILVGGSGTNDTPKTSSVMKADIPFGFKIPKPVVPTSKEYSSDNERRRRSPSVVARLMGLDALPDPASVTTSEQQSCQHAKDQSERLSIAQKLLKEAKVRYPSEQAKTPELKTGKHLNVAKHSQLGVVDQTNGEYQRESVVSREKHPQEKQLQEFKRQFACKFSSQGHENRQRSLSESFNREAEVKRVMVEGKTNEAKAVPARGEKNDPKRLTAALEKLNKSKEFQEVLEVLQSNKEFFLKFLQDPNAILLDRHSLDTLTDENAYTMPPPIEVKAREESSKEKSSEKRKKGGMSPSAFARRFMESRREGKESKEKSKSQRGSKSQSEAEENTPRTSTSLLPRFRGKSKSKAAEIDRELALRNNERSEQNLSLDRHSPGSIVLLRPGSTESTGMSSPASVISYSPRVPRVGKESSPKGYKLVEETREYHHQLRERIPGSEEISREGWDYVNQCDDISRRSKESSRPREKERNERERSKESRDIARDIIREARASVRAFGKLEPSVAVERTFSRDGSTGRRITLLRSTPENGDLTGSSDGEVTPSSAGRLSTTFSRDERPRPSSGLGGLSNLSSAVTAHFSPRPSQDFVSNGKIFGDQRNRRGGDKQQALQKAPIPPRKSLLDKTDNLSCSSRSRSVSSSSRVLRKAIAGSVLENRALAADSWHPPQYHDVTLPQLLVTGERMTSTSQSEDENGANSPGSVSSGSLQRCRSVPNAALLRDSRSPQRSTGGRYGSMLPLKSPSVGPSVSESLVAGGKQFADSYKRGVEAVGSMFARAKSKQRNKIFVRSRKKPQTPADEPIAPCSLESSQESLSLNFSISLESSVTASEDMPGALFDVSDASPIEWSRILAENESETEASDMSNVHRISIASDLDLSFEREQPRSPSARPSIEQQLPQALSMLIPRGQRVRVNADMATDRCSSPADSITDILEVLAGDQLARSPKIRLVATEASRNEDDDAREPVVDKGGQPSPISVLESPFEEDSPSPLEFNEISSDLQELRLRLRLLKLDGSDRPRPSMDSNQDSKGIETREILPDLVERESLNKESVDCQICNTVHSSKICTPEAIEVAVSPAVGPEVRDIERGLLEMIDLEGFPYPEGSREDLVYVRNLLVASGFVGSAINVFTRWHSPNQPLDPILFENVEDYYNRKNEPQCKNGHTRSTGVAHAKPGHRLLFDAVNEVLLRKFGPYLSFCPWVQPITPLLRPIPLGRMLVWETWMELCGFFPSRTDASTFLLDRDLGRGMEWIDEREGVEELGLEIEKAIFDDLMDETVSSLILSSLNRDTSSLQLTSTKATTYTTHPCCS